MKIKYTRDGYMSYCVVGGCPEIKRDGGEFLIRNSHDRDLSIRFSKDDLIGLQAALKDHI